MRLVRPRRQVLSCAVAAALIAAGGSAAWAQYEVPNPIYAAPGTYYNTATGTGATLKANLNAIIDNHTSYTYSGSAHDAAMLKLDEDPNNTANVLLVYNGVSISKGSVLNVNYNREHLWPNSYGLDDTNPAFSDLWNLRVCDANVNSDRGNDYYDNGGADAHPEAPDCNQVPGTSWEPRPIEKGDLARSMFYMDTRYEGDADGDNFPRNLTLVGTGQLSTIDADNNNMGNLSTLLQWHYQDGVSNSERRRNHLIYTSDTGPNGWNGTARNQGNRNPFVDRPELVWSVFGGGNNNSQVKVGSNVDANGTSSTTANLRVMKNGTWGTGSVAITKLGTNPTTYDVTASGNVVTAAAGPGQAFDYNTQVRNINVSLNDSTATVGAKTGTVTLNNTDITSGGTGLGSADGNDTINVLGQVVDNRVITASDATFGRVIVGANVNQTTNLASPGSDDTNTRVTVLGSASTADSNGVFIAAGGNRTYNGTITTGTRTVTANFATAGSKSGSRGFNLQGEGLTGEVVNPVTVNYTATAVDHAQPSLAPSPSIVSSQTIDFGYVPSGFAARTANFNVYNHASANGATLTAGMDVDGSTIGGAGVGSMTDNVVVTNPATPLAAGGSITYTATFTPTSGGDKTATHTIAVSDENIPGTTVRPSLVLTTAGHTLASATFPTSGFIDLFTGETYNTGAFAIASGVTIDKRGPGVMNITGAQSNGANSTLNITGGAVNMSTDAGANLAVATSAGTSVSFASPQHLRSLTLSGGGHAAIAPGVTNTVVAGSLSIDNASRIDLGDNSLIAKDTPAGSWNGSAYTGVVGLVQSGFAGGDWSGNGIVTTMSDAASPSVLTTLAVASAAEVFGLSGADTATFMGETVTANDTLVKYTYGGDADLNGELNGDDYFQIDSNINLAGSVFGYRNGDFNYDGDLNGDDYFIIDSNINAQGVPFPSSSAFTGVGGLTAVPEPAAIAAVFVAACAFARRRRRD